MIIDNDSFFRNFIDSLFIMASWVAPVKVKTGIVGVSQVWSDIPQWYLWVNGTPGPFDLALQFSETVFVEGRPMALGRFTVKCFPYASDDVFGTFSEHERRCLNSDIFDHTHTPVFERKSDIPDTHFVVGLLTVTADVKAPLCMFTYDSLDTLRSITRNVRPGPEEGCQVTRQVPGWRIGYALFDRLVGLYAFYSKIPPIRYGATQSPGFETILGVDDAHECQINPGLSQLSSSILFRGLKIPLSHDRALWQSRLETNEKVVFESEFVNGPVHPSDKDVSILFPVNALWWELATMTACSNLASTCGCESSCDHEHLGMMSHAH